MVFGFGFELGAQLTVTHGTNVGGHSSRNVAKAKSQSQGLLCMCVCMCMCMRVM